MRAGETTRCGWAGILRASGSSCSRISGSPKTTLYLCSLLATTLLSTASHCITGGVYNENLEGETVSKIKIFFSVVSARLESIIEEGLEGQEYVTVLQWVLTTYPGPDLMGSQSLNLEKNLVPPLLTEAAVTRLIESYLGNMRDNYNNWMTNTIKQEKEDWCSDKDPEMDFDGFFHTSSPVIIYQMVDENLQVSASVVTNSRKKYNWKPNMVSFGKCIFSS